MRTSVPEKTLRKIEPVMPYAVRECRRAAEERSIREAEKNLSVGFLLEVLAPGKMASLGISIEEGDALAGLAHSGRYEEEPPWTPEQVVKPVSYAEQNKAILAEQEKNPLGIWPLVYSIPTLDLRAFKNEPKCGPNGRCLFHTDLFRTEDHSQAALRAVEKYRLHILGVE